MARSSTGHFRKVEHGSKEYENLLTLRFNALRAPLGLVWTPEDREKDKSDHHFGLFNHADAQASAVSGPFCNKDIVKVRQVAVREDLRGKGIGRAMMLQTETFLKVEGVKVVELHARLIVAPFYEALGYSREGGVFKEAGIPHSAHFGVSVAMQAGCNRYHFRECRIGSELYTSLRDLRFNSLLLPLHLSWTPEFLAQDKTDRHFGIFSEDQAVSSTVAHPLSQNRVKLRQVAVRAEMRSQGFGRRVVEETENLLFAEGVTFFTLNAQETVVRFYEALGYCREGELVVEVGIPHVRMIKEKV